MMSVSAERRSFGLVFYLLSTLMLFLERDHFITQRDQYLVFTNYLVAMAKITPFLFHGSLTSGKFGKEGKK